MTLPEREGWVDRERLYDFSGRSRKPQMGLARAFGITDYAQPAGGCCFLTDVAYSAKLQDLWQQRGDKRYELDDIMLLKVGRHLRPRPNYKLIIGREDGENRFLEGYRRQYTALHTSSHNGPLALLDGHYDDDDLLLAARIVARYSQGRDADRVAVEVTAKERGTSRTLTVTPFTADDIPREWHI